MKMMSWVIVWSAFVLLPLKWSTHPHLSIRSGNGQDTVIYYPGTFRWDEGTVVQTSEELSAYIVHYLDLLDHVNVDFSASPASVIYLTLQEEAHPGVGEILVREDTIQLATPTPEVMEKAVQYLRKMKMEGVQRSPDYGLLYIRCGLYRFKEF